ncbi:hypothetical protein [Demequina globuliformis]|uniref:hypothetical protein n=1 Tax=Demequina globuliformis TaxID=676202 RepID=UPI000786132D|nr:hypothetical protein [Demequina globuliformis]
MKGLRTLLSALSIVAGSLLIVAWAVSSIVVATVKDGTALTGITQTAFDVPGVMSALSRQVQDQTVQNLDQRGIDTEALGVDEQVRTVVDDAVRSDEFEAAVVAQVTQAQDAFLAQLTDADRDPQPLVLAVDVSSMVNARIDDLGGVAALAPDVTVPPVDVEVLDADQMADAQTGYAWMEWLAAWGLWVGLGLLALGILVSHRRRWFLGKALIALGILSLGFGLVVRFVEPQSVMAFLPGGEDGLLGSVWTQSVTEGSAPAIATRAMLIGAACLLGSVVMLALGRLVGGRR